MLASELVENFFSMKKGSIYTKMVVEELKDINQTNLNYFFFFARDNLFQVLFVGTRYYEDEL